MNYRFNQVNVFSSDTLKGNPLAVVFCDDECISEKDMKSLARWTNLSETVFIFPPTHPKADYKVRIFTPLEELPFAGHPSIGSCYSWLDGQNKKVIYQESAIGIVEIRQMDGMLYFEAPPLQTKRPFTLAELDLLYKSTNLKAEDVVSSCVLNNGPIWHSVLIKSPEKLMGIYPDYSEMVGVYLGVCALSDDKNSLHVRAFVGSEQTEDPVTGSLNAVLAQWLTINKYIPAEYTSFQGSSVGANGEVFIRLVDKKIFVGGKTNFVIRGEISL